jgi:flagellar protein FliO/FliZ
MLGDMPLPAKFFIAFVLVLALIGGVAWLVRRFGSGALSASAGRGRQARLGVIEATAVDSRRRLVLVRRDNVEHLIMLGGPTDLVVEASIVRAHAAAGREAPPPRAPEPTGWPAQVDEGWPAAPEPAFRPIRGAERTAPPAVSDDLPLQPYPEPALREPAPREPALREPAPRPGADRLAGLTAELGRAGGGRVEPQVARAGGGRVEPQVARPEPPARRPVEARRAPPPPRPAEEPHAGDEHLASMAQQLEAALRRPGQAAPARDSVGEPRAAGLTARRPAEPHEQQRNSLIERAKQARSSASLATPRTRDVREARPAEPQPAPVQNVEADVAMVDEPLPPPAGATPPAAPIAETSAPEGPQGPVEHAEQPAETKPPSLEEEMANLLGRSPGRT